MVFADRSWSALALARWCCIFGAIGLLVGVGVAIDDGDLVALFVVPPLVGTLGLLPGAAHATWWALGPGRVTYAVDADGHFVCRRGHRVMRRWPCAHVVELTMTAPMDWFGVLISGWFGWADVLPDAYIKINNGDRWSPLNGTHRLPSGMSPK